MFRPSKKLTSKDSSRSSSSHCSRDEITRMTHGLIVLGSALGNSRRNRSPCVARTFMDDPRRCPGRVCHHNVEDKTAKLLKTTWEDDDENRRGGISYERADKNAIYVRALGDGRMRGKTGLGDACQLMEWERKLIEKLSQPDCRMRFRSRFLSLNRVHRRRRPNLRLNRENKQAIDENYYQPAQLLLQHSSDWDFDVFHLDTLTGGRSLLHLAYHIFREYGFIQRFRLDSIKLLCFFSSIEDNYHDSNPYHNVIHASDVTQAMYCYLQEEKLLKSVTPFEAMMTVMAAMAHDLDHPGVNQTFLVATANHLATLYQNTSVLEMHHWRYGVGLMQECGIFSHFTHSQWATAIWQFRSLILATDITRQQEFLLKFRRMIDEREFEYESNLNARHFVLQIALKCADICNPCRKWELSERWSRQVCEEFFRQGDMERQVGVPVTPVCDRHVNTVAKIQIGFMEVVVRPLFMEWKRFLPTEMSTKMLSNILINKQNWQLINEKEALAKAAAVARESNATEAEDTLRDGNRNNATTTGASGQSTSIQAEMGEAEVLEEEEVLIKVEERHGEDAEGEEEKEGRGALLLAGEEQGEEEEEARGEEADTVENDINLAFHYQTDSEQASESGSYSLATVSEEEQLMALARNSRRRHSMPVVIRRDLGFYMGLRQDIFPYHHAHFQFQRRQSLPATPLFPSSIGVGARVGDSSSVSSSSSPHQKKLSMEGLLTRPKISNLSSSLDTRVDYLSFLPLQSQTRLLQRGAAWGDTPDVNDLSAAASGAAASGAAPLSSHPHFHHHQPPSSSVAEMRRSSHGFKEDSGLLRTALGNLVGSGHCQQELVGLASSWPSILHGGQRVDDVAALKQLADRAGLTSPEADLGSHLSHSGGGGGVGDRSDDGGGGGGSGTGGDGGGSSSSTNSNNNVVAPACLSSSQAEGVSLLSRPH